MRRLLSGALALTLLAALDGTQSLPAADAPAGSAEDHLAPLARFVGEWQVDGKWADGTPLHARSVTAWGVNKKIIVEKIFVKDADKPEYQRYEGIMAWDPKKKSLFDISFAFDGDMSETLIDSVDKDTLHFGYRPFHEGEPSVVRQIIHFTGNDAYEWTVSLKQGNDWANIIQATWRRKAK
jgi:hypothetical protein